MVLGDCYVHIFSESHKHKLNMADFILNMPPGLFARVFGNPAGDPVLLKSRGVTLLRDKLLAFLYQFLPKNDKI